MVVAQDIGEQLLVAIETRGRRLVSLIDLFERAAEPLAVAHHQREREIALGCKMVVDARLADPDVGSDVGVTEAAEPLHLDQPLRRIEDAIARVCNGRDHDSQDSARPAGWEPTSRMAAPTKNAAQCAAFPNLDVDRSSDRSRRRLAEDSHHHLAEDSRHLAGDSRLAEDSHLAAGTAAEAPSAVPRPAASN